MKRRDFLTVVVCICILAAVAVFLYVYLSTPRDSRHADAQKLLQSTDSQKFTDASGNEITLHEHSGKVRILTFWASWNPFSPTDLKVLSAVSGMYKDKSDRVSFIAVNRKETKEQVERFLSAQGELPGIEIIIDINDTLYTSALGYAMPETVVFDARGTKILQQRGSLNEQQLMEIVNAELSQ